MINKIHRFLLRKEVYSWLTFFLVFSAIWIPTMIVSNVLWDWVDNHPNEEEVSDNQIKHYATLFIAAFVSGFVSAGISSTKWGKKYM